MYRKVNKHILISIFFLTLLFCFLIPVNNRLTEEPYIEVNSSEALEGKINKLTELLNDEFLILVNKDNPLSTNYLASDIEDSNLNFISYITTTKLNSTAKNNALEMFSDAKMDGIHLICASGYRAYSVQKNLFDSNVKKIGREEALKYSAEPGTSEHETGLALDIVCTEYQNLNDDFENTAAFKWLKENCYKYGFILRYPKNKTEITKYAYEPWHYRYVGIFHAKKINENGLSLEEYISKINDEISYLKSNLNN